MERPIFVQLTSVVPREGRRTYKRWCNLATVTDISECDGSTKLEFVTGRFERVKETAAEVLALGGLITASHVGGERHGDR